MNKKFFQKIILLAAAGVFLAGAYFFQARVFLPGVKGVSDLAAPLGLASSASSSPRLLIYFFDVGQGDSALIRTPEGNDILIDGGPDDTVVQKLGEYLPYGDRDIELIILSHPHSDHVVGLNEVLERYQVKKILMTGALHTAPDYLNFLNLIKEKNIPVELANGTRSIALGAVVNFDILFPDHDLSGQKIDNLNNSSIVGKLIYASTSVLFTGDYEEEEKLVEKNPPLVQGEAGRGLPDKNTPSQPPPYKGGGVSLRADILKVGHHGSNNANCRELIEAVNPKYAVISVGRDNSFGHPHYRALYYLQKFGAEIFRTDEDGDIIFGSDGKRFQFIK